ncbi:MAG TPA: aspartate aminotransferase family protein [Candidatus Omnitrophica bacterium]|nr:aspartate aminotransferase family protein [Candidatus Omnitrophota bacterium]
MEGRSTDVLLEKAKRLFAGGVNSPVRSFAYVGGRPLLIKRGSGSKVYGYDGRRYIDYVLSWGSLILGHAYPQVIRDLKKNIGLGLSFGMTSAPEIELAERIHKAVPFIEKIRFVNSGTEAVMGAVRLARAVTRRDTILKFENSYHGHADHLLAKAGSGLSTLSIPVSSGIPEDFIKHTLVLPLGDPEKLKRIFETRGNDIAAVLVEPVGGNYGVLPPDAVFLKLLRKLTKAYGVKLIFDEVITGFRFGFGAFAQKAGITPDLICLGKIIGGGLPIGAYGGHKQIMDNLAPSGSVYQASTFSANPVVMRAGIATLEALEKLKDDYPRLGRLAEAISSGLKAEAKARGIGLNVIVFGGMFSLKFAHKKEFGRFYRKMLKQGVLFAPSEFEANFLSFAHSKEDIDRTITSAKRALRCI